MEMLNTWPHACCYSQNYKCFFFTDFPAFFLPLLLLVAAYLFSNFQKELLITECIISALASHVAAPLFPLEKQS
jgi:hypothetical protein